MTHNQDLKRWNRSGLPRFRYIDGNAVKFLEILREAFARNLTQWKAVKLDEDDTSLSGNESPLERDEILQKIEDRLLNQYHYERQDWGWEISRTLARASHVLTEHIDAFANEGYLRTATQWESVRRLVEMLDYHPAPPASATTHLVLFAKDGMRDIVSKHFQVNHTPITGGEPIIFETLADLEIDSQLNELRPVGHNSSPELIKGRELVLESAIEDLEIGSPVVISNDNFFVARLIEGVEIGDNQTTIRLSHSISPRNRFRKGETTIHLKPKDRLDPLGPGASGTDIYRSLELEEAPRDLRVGDVAVIVDQKSSPDRFHYRCIDKISDRTLRFDKDVGSISPDNSYVSPTVRLSVVSRYRRAPLQSHIYGVRVAGDYSRLNGKWVADLVRTDGNKTELIEFRVTSAKYKVVTGAEDPTGGYTTLALHNSSGRISNPQSIYIPPETGVWKVDTYLEKSGPSLAPRNIVVEQPKKTTGGDFAVIVKGNVYSWARLNNVSVDEENATATISADRWHKRKHQSNAQFYLKQTNIFGHFSIKARPLGWQENKTKIVGTEIKLELASIPTSLHLGKKIILEQLSDNGCTKARVLSIASINKNQSAIVLDSLVEKDDGYTKSNLIIRGNVVEAGHGASKPEKVLGSGDATRSNQSFVFETAGVSFVSDPTQTSGVAAAIAVRIGTQTWLQVSTLANSKPDDPHYTVRMTEEGYLKISFGDGRRGRRLLTATNNVRISYRKGVGASGNLPSGSLEKPVKPNPFVDSVHQPTLSTGGNDMEGIESLREDALASLLTLERAVSIRDYALLANSHSSVWQALAHSKPGGVGRRKIIEVVVVTAGGGELGLLRATLRAYLENYSIPGIQVIVKDYVPVLLGLRVEIRVKVTEFDPEILIESVRKALLEGFSLEKRKLAQTLYLSEVYSIVERITGVENSTCVMNGDASLRALSAENDQVIYLDPNGVTLEITHKEFHP